MAFRISIYLIYILVDREYNKFIIFEQNLNQFYFSVKFFTNGGRVIWIDNTNSKRAQWNPPSAVLKQAPQVSKNRPNLKPMAQQKKLYDSTDVLPGLNQS